MSFWSIFLEASIVNKAILFILLGLSVYSWAVIIERYRFFRRAERMDSDVLEAAGSELNLSNLKKASVDLPDAPLAGLYIFLMDVLSTLVDWDASRLSDILEAGLERTRMAGEKRLHVLAMIASASPFIGLLGTVWGVMIAFLKLGDLQGQPALELVGPGIAEALIATAAGLFAAIPATIAYNYFVAAHRTMIRRAKTFSHRLVVKAADGRAAS